MEKKNPRTKGQKGREGRSEFKVIDLCVKVFGEFELPELNSRKNTFYGLSWYELDKWLACLKKKKTKIDTITEAQRKSGDRNWNTQSISSGRFGKTVKKVDCILGSKAW